MRWLLLLALLLPGPVLAETLPAFRVTPAGREAPASLLIPSSHQPEPGLLPPAPEAFEGRAALLLESVEDAEDVGDLLRAPPGFAVLDPFPPAERRLLEAAIACTRLVPEPLSPLGLFLALLAATQPPAAPCPGLPAPPATPEGAPAAGGDPALRELARRRGLPIQGLETRREMLLAVRGMGGDAVLRLVSLMARQMRQGDPVLEVRMAQALLAGDFDRLRAQLLAPMAAEPGLAQAFARQMLDGRNAVMARRLAQRLPRESLVIAIGAAHAAGPSGVPALLRRAGFRVEAVRIPAAPLE
ncbi:TraB/GumN family protein [Falsiroseomonas tokyonensis]|uniref:TraB/GumN family protein n=1 Tax=Falsiroseomonas tokyonensis TaxID=430521 RepID=A0ABV7BY15_9PROT|nr:TraB/GumN family protein [Falsiroseomonas tokyonensis]MBU8539899.1 TraB/GumN family protein [Falsiroseomonas tokyonensis]